MIEFVADRPGHDQRYSVDTTKVRALGWAPSRSFEEALDDTIAWYRANEWWWRPLKEGGASDRRGDATGQPRALTEFDAIAPLNVYGRSKAAGERLVRETLRQHHIIRTAWVCGARGNNFVRTMLRLTERGEPISVVDDQIGSPTFTRDLAAATREIAVSGRYGTWNRTNAGRCSWYDLAAATFELAGVEVDLRRQSSAALDRPAPRPSWSVLDDTHATAAGLTPLPAWRDGLRDLLAELGAHGRPT
jgi:dTDP-4-dehydrorhamnose reductase